jgi:hypothetical protein
MKAVLIAILAALAACKSEAKPAAKAAPATPAEAPAARAPGPRPALPSEGDQPARPQLPASDGKWHLDKDGDGVVSPEERQAAHEERAKRIIEHFDANHDGKLTPDELAAAGSAQRGVRFADPREVDANNDGEISADELQAAIRQRQLQWRVHRGHGSDAVPIE